MNQITTDPSQRVDLYFRTDSIGVPITFTFLESDGSPYSFIYDDFQLVIKPYVGSKKNTLLLGFGTGLSLTANRLTAQIDTSNVRVEPGEYYWELIKNDYGRPWLTGIAYAVAGNLPAISNSTSVTVNEGGYDITITIDEAAPVDSGFIALSDFTTELLFDQDKEFETLAGGTTTFTLASSGHKNGVGIIARINTPTAVNFPAGFEAVNGSDAIATGSMNIIIFRYFEDYDGAGNDKVLYLVKNQTAV